MRELAGELERKKNGGRKKKEEKPERERENRKCLFNERRERSVIIFFFKFFLPLSYSAYLKIDVHCSCEAKIFRFNSTDGA